MEHSASLRSLEASGRPSGTGRPSLSAPRNENQTTPPGEGSEAASKDSTAFDSLVRNQSRRRTQRQAQGKESQPTQEPANSTAAPRRETSSEVDGSGGATVSAEASESGTTANPSLDLLVPVQLPLASQNSPSAAGVSAAGASAVEPHAQQSQPLLALPQTTELADAASSPTADVKAAFEPLVDPELADPLLAAKVDVQQVEASGRGLEALSAKAEKAPETSAARTEAGRQPQPEHPTPKQERAADILQQMRVHLQANTRSAVIQLSPPELGMLMIQIRMEEDKLRAVVRAERPEALEALNRHLPELRATLQQQGLQANDIHLELGLGSREQAREEALLQAQSQGSRRDARSGSASTQSALLARILSPRIGGVDLYA